MKNGQPAQSAILRLYDAWQDARRASNALDPDTAARDLVRHAQAVLGNVT